MADGKVRYSKVSRRMWNDADFRSLSSPPPNAQTLWLRFLTGPELTAIPGLFSAWEAGLAQSLRWSLEGFREAFREAFAKGLVKADWEAGLVWVPNAPKHNKPESPNVIRGWATAWDELPECRLKAEAYHELKAFAEALGKGFAQAFGEACRQPSPNQEQEQEQEREKPPVSPPWGATAMAILIPSEPTKPRRGGRAPRTLMAEDWEPSAKCVASVVSEHAALGLDVLAYVPEFRRYWLGEGKPMADWNATFANRVAALVKRGEVHRAVVKRPPIAPAKPWMDTLPPLDPGERTEGPFTDLLAGILGPNPPTTSEVVAVSGAVAGAPARFQSENVPEDPENVLGHPRRASRA